MLARLARLLTRQLGDLSVQPATLLGWHRDLAAKHLTSAQGRTGRPGIAMGTTALLLRLAKEDPKRGHRLIHEYQMDA